jgi:BirA family biotin operon repressor/biotin-[acetyl-CoA-carboxylase] ligase
MDKLESRAIRVPGVDVRVVRRCASTNSLLLAEGAARPALLAADVQTAGRGRRGRRWHSAAGAGVLFSLSLPMGRPARALSGLSIVAGLAAVRTLRALGAADVALKWPNDLLVRGAKLGGILVETRSRDAGSVAVVGIGINHAPVAGLSARLRRSVAALAQLLRPLPARSAVIGALARDLLAALRAFDATGFEPFRAGWSALDAHAGKRLRVRLDDGRMVAGTTAGLAADGALLLRTARGLRTVRNGRVVSVA